jgi:RimJ/RimL family protein N-acetyltransferase
MIKSGQTLETERLVLRPWRDSDLDPFAEMGTDVRVMEYFLSTVPRSDSARMVESIRQHFAEHGYGFWAVEVEDGAPFIGFVGLQHVAFEADFRPAVEVGWRLAFEAWGHGYASEAAREALRFAFEELALPEIVSFTAAGNLRSRAVMERIGLIHDPHGDFDHPRIPEGHPLRRHVLYRIEALTPS